MRTLNVPLLLILTLLAAGTATGVYFLHEWQLHRNAQFLLTLADRYEENGQPGQAVGSLGRYVAMVPDDTAALARLGLLQAKRHADAQAYVVLEQVLRREPARDDIRRELVEVAMRIGRYGDARDHLEQYLLKTERDNAHLLNLLGICQEKLGDSSAAAKQFASAIAAQPDFLDSYVSLARLYTRMKEADDANEVLAKLVENNPDSDRGYRAYLMRASFRQEQMANPMPAAERDDLLSQAEDDARAALKLVEDNPDGYLLAAELARAHALAHPDDEAARDRAREYIAQGLEVYENGGAEATKTLPGFYRLLANLELDDGHRDLAIEALRRGVEKVQSPPDKATLQWSLAESLIDEGGLAEARTVIEGLRTEAAFAPFVTYLDARVKLAEEKWQEGATELERLSPRLADVPELAKQVDFWLGRSYGMLHREEEELAAYRRAVEADDRWVAPQCLLAGALAKAGRVHDAVEHYRRAMQLPGCPSEVYQVLARLRVVETLRQPSAKQDWKDIDGLLKAASQRMPDSVEVAVLQAQVDVARGAWDDARQRLAQATGNHPDDLNVRLAAIALERLRADWDEAERLLRAAREHLGDRVELRLEQASLIEAREGAKAVSALLELAQGAASFSTDDQARLRVGLAGHLQAVGATQQAKELAEEVAGESPQNLAANLLLFDLAVAENDDSSMAKWLQGIKGCKSDADAPILALYGDAVRLVLAVETSPDRSSERQRAKLQKASNALNEARGQRPAWPRLALLLARIEELRDKPALAIPLFQQAVDSGAGDGVAIHLIVLLAAQKDYDQAERLLRLLDEKQAALTPEVAPSAFSALSHGNDFVKALELAHRACAASNDCQHHIWFGRIATEVVLAGKLREGDERNEWLAKAEQAFQHAIQLDQHEVGAWFGLLNFYKRTGRTQELEEATERARQQLAASELHLVLTRYYQSIDDVPGARQQLELALTENPDEPRTLRGAAEFHIVRHELAEARPLLEHLLAPQVKAEPADRAFARQNLALVHLSDRTYGSFLKAVELVKGDDPENPANRRATAILLARSPAGADRRQAIEILKDLQAQSLVDNADLFLLAQLYWMRRQHAEALETMASLLEKSANNADYAAGYARMLLDETRLEDAEPWIKRLEGLEPQSARTADLRARALAMRRRESKAVKVLEDVLAQSPDGADASKFDRGQLGGLLEAIANWKPARGGPRPEEFLKAAERQFRQAAADSPSPERQTALAGFLGRHGKVREALRLYDELWSNNQFDAAAVGYAGLASQGHLNASQLIEAERRIGDLLAKQPDSMPLLAALARVYRAQGKQDLVESTYRTILAASPNNVVALNNLAVLLTLRQSNAEEARRLIERALELGGPSPALLDSRAMVELAAGDPQPAIHDLEEATADEPSPEYYFHLAQAHLKRNDLNAAGQAIEKGRSLGLDEQSLHPLERDAYQQVLAVLPQPPSE